MIIESNAIEMLNEHFDELEQKGIVLPNFNNSSEIIIISDYSGERREDTFNAYSFLVLDKASYLKVIPAIQKLRAQEPEWKDNSFMEYKKIKRDRVRLRVLKDFIRLIDDVNGLLFNVLLDKESFDFFQKVTDEDLKEMKEKKYGEWKKHIFQKSINILYIISFLMKRFSSEKNHLTWYSDKDDIFGANQAQVENTLDILSVFLNKFEVKSKDNTVTFFSDSDMSPDSDFMSIVDLSAGSLLEYHQNSHENFDNYSEITKTTYLWTFLNFYRLKKISIICKVDSENKTLVGLESLVRDI